LRPRRQNDDGICLKGGGVECRVAFADDTKSAIASFARARRKPAAIVEPGGAIFSRRSDRRAAARKSVLSLRGDGEAQHVRQDHAYERDRREPARQSLHIPPKHRHISMGGPSEADVNAQASFRQKMLGLLLECHTDLAARAADSDYESRMPARG
jgi:hypothetical protein